MRRSFHKIPEPNFAPDFGGVHFTAHNQVTTREGGCMQTFTGRPFWPCDPRPEEVRIVDIAHHLSMLCRYTGAVKRFYSVAEHCVLVSYLVPPRHALRGLLHDGPEAYTNDINRPLKHGPGLEGYLVIEDRIWRAVCARFGLAYDDEEGDREVGLADDGICLLERDALLMPTANWPNDNWERVTPHPNAAKVTVRGLPPEQAEIIFLDRFFELTKGGRK